MKEQNKHPKIQDVRTEREHIVSEFFHQGNVTEQNLHDAQPTTGKEREYRIELGDQVIVIRGVTGYYM